MRLTQILLTAICFQMVVGCGGGETARPVTMSPAVELPAAIVDHITRKAKGGRRSQIRAVIATETHTQLEIEQFALALAERYDFDHALVTFFDDASVFAHWDGKGSLVDSDWPHCLCRVLFDDGVTVFQLAMDEGTSEDRTDVLLTTAADREE